MTRASLAVVMDTIVAVVTSPGWSAGERTGRAAPTASMHVCGGLITAENDEIPNIPRFDILQQTRPLLSCMLDPTNTNDATDS